MGLQEELLGGKRRAALLAQGVEAQIWSCFLLSLITTISPGSSVSHEMSSVRIKRFRVETELLADKFPGAGVRFQPECEGLPRRRGGQVTGDESLEGHLRETGEAREHAPSWQGGSQSQRSRPRSATVPLSLWGRRCPAPRATLPLWARGHTPALERAGTEMGTGVQSRGSGFERSA